MAPSRSAGSALSLMFTLLVTGGLGGQEYHASGITFLSNLTIPQMGGSSTTGGNDLWGWTDETTGREYALFGRTNGTSFVDVTDPLEPVYVGNLPSFTSSSTWRDIKVYGDYAYVVADNNGPHGLQIFDLTQLRGVTSPQIFSTSFHNNSFRSAHNIFINEDSGFAYVVGSNQAAGGLHVLDLSDPTTPIVAGGFSADGYTHDTQVVIYNGPDTGFQGKEIAFNSNEDTLTIVDVSHKSQMTQLSRQSYPRAAYVHQGWLSEDQRYFFQNDELDELFFSDVPFTRTHIWDVQSLTDPEYVGFYEHEGVTAIDHNYYVKGDLLYQANYTSGLRVLRINDAGNLDLQYVGYFDTVPGSDSPAFDGAWSVYPYFDSRTILLSDQQTGLWVVRIGLPCDFNADEACDAEDIDLLTGQGDLVAGFAVDADDPFDLTGDGVVDQSDLLSFLDFAAAENGFDQYYLGDANLDGVVDVDDFNAWSEHRFSLDAVWSQGDFDGNGVIDVTDFHVWNENKFQQSAALPGSMVPEPASSLGFWLVIAYRLTRVRLRGCR